MFVNRNIYTQIFVTKDVDKKLENNPKYKNTVEIEFQRLCISKYA